ncbi:MAG: N-acetylmuramoyl-L-alanine amidase [Candidatus Azobacteroides sp.]|nr:N-acetylmuramoyl-L-alanine amidase [Candidatus Azobacteroides sp.]
MVIDPGHGGKDPGALGKISKEKDLNLAIAKRVGDLIKSSHKDVKVIYTRTTDKALKPLERAELANRSKADLFISIHANAMENKKMKGTETYIYGIPSGKEAQEVARRENAGQDSKLKDTSSQKNNATVEKNRLLATEIQKAFKKGKRIDKGVKQARFVVLKYTRMPAVLVEIGYISNESEEKYMNSVAGQKAISKAIYTGFANYKKASDQGFKNTKSSTNQQKTTTTASKTQNNKQKTTQGQKKKTTYRVQFLLSDTKLPANSPKFKGLSPVGHYVENGLYKYTYGNTSNVEEIKKKHAEAKKLFNDAFIVIFEDGKRVGIYPSGK